MSTSSTAGLASLRGGLRLVRTYDIPAPPPPTGRRRLPLPGSEVSPLAIDRICHGDGIRARHVVGRRFRVITRTDGPPVLRII